MLKKAVGLFVVLLVVCVPLLGSNNNSDNAPEILTNESIIPLCEVGLDEKVIVRKISETRGVFNKTTDGLIALKEAGCTTAVITAVMGINTPEETRGPQATATYVQPFYGVRLVTRDGTREMYTATPAGKKFGGALGGIGSAVGLSKTKVRIQNSTSRFRINEFRPTFEVSMPSLGDDPLDNIVLIAVESKKDARIFTAGKMGFSTWKAEIPDAIRRDVVIEAIPGQHAAFRAFRVQPRNPLDRGEYVLMAGHQYYDFGIDAEGIQVASHGDG